MEMSMFEALSQDVASAELRKAECGDRQVQHVALSNRSHVLQRVHE